MQPRSCTRSSAACSFMAAATDSATEGAIVSNPSTSTGSATPQPAASGTGEAVLASGSRGQPTGAGAEENGSEVRTKAPGGTSCQVRCVQRHHHAVNLFKQGTRLGHHLSTGVGDECGESVCFGYRGQHSW